MISWTEKNSRMSWSRRRRGLGPTVMKSSYLVLGHADDAGEGHGGKVLIRKSRFHQTRARVKHDGGLEVRHLHTQAATFPQGFNFIPESQARASGPRRLSVSRGGSRVFVSFMMFNVWCVFGVWEMEWGGVIIISHHYHISSSGSFLRWVFTFCPELCVAFSLDEKCFRNKV